MIYIQMISVLGAIFSLSVGICYRFDYRVIQVMKETEEMLDYLEIKAHK